MTNRPGKIFPRNLTARAAHVVAGNPATSRPEDAVGNCYPGLELDVRNLDRRFFPGLVFDFIARNDVSSPYTYPQIYGAKLAYVDADQDPDLLPNDDLTRRLREELTGDSGSSLKDGVWYIDWIEQGDKRLHMYRLDTEEPRQPLDGLAVWRLIRGLEPQQLILNLKARGQDKEVCLRGWRRRYTDSHSGVISTAFQPGELTQGLCSPWQHDFRDCACNYWASNHPDIVFAEIDKDAAAAAGVTRTLMQIDWLRADRSPEMAAGAFDTLPENRPYQLDHYQINSEWKKLNVVLGGREIDSIFTPDVIDTAVPYASPAELGAKLAGVLAPLEMTLAIEYLYARFSLLSGEQAEKAARRDNWVTLPEDIIFLRHNLMLVAVSEMQHLRWVNNLLWELHNSGLIPSFTPVLELAKTVPSGSKGDRSPELRALHPEVLDDFIAVEHPSGLIDGAYARVVATLRNASIYPPRMLEIAERIISDGVDHERRFLDMRRVLRSYEGAVGNPPYLRDIRLGDAGDDEVGTALACFEDIKANLMIAYSDAAQGNVAVSGEYVTRARVSMNRLLTVGEALGEQGVGIPFWR